MSNKPKPDRPAFQRQVLECNLEPAYFIECSWCGNKGEQSGYQPGLVALTQDKAATAFYKEGWRIAADNDQQGVACPECKRQYHLKICADRNCA